MNTTGIEVSESYVSSADPLKKALGALLVSTKDIIDESQKVLNIRGLGFKNVIPAIVGRWAAYKYKGDGRRLLPQTDQHGIQKSG